MVINVIVNCFEVLFNWINSIVIMFRNLFSKDSIWLRLLPQDVRFELKTSQDITNIAIIVIFVLFCISLFLIVLRYSWRYYRDNKNLLKEIEKVSKEGISQTQCPIEHELFRKYYNGLIWREGRVYSTIPVDEVFSYDTLATNIANPQQISNIVTLLTGLGVLGTFLGLTVGLKDLTFDGTSLEIVKQIKNMTACASTAFVTSVWGVGSGLILNLFRYGIWAFILRGKINKVKKKIEEVFPLTSPVDDFMVSVKENLASSNDTLSKLAEEIGSRMQTNVETLASKIADALSMTSSDLGVLIERITDVVPERICDGLSKSMEPAVNQLVQASTEMNNRSFDSSQGALEALVERFINEVGRAGIEQRGGIENATNSLRDLLQDNAIKTRELFDMLITQQQKQSEGINAQSLNMVSNVENMLSGFVEKINGEIADSNMKQRENLSVIIEKLQETLQASTEQSNKVFEKLSEQQTNHVETVKEQETKVLAEIGSMLSKHQTSIDSFENILKQSSSSSQEIVGKTQNVQKVLSSNIESLEELYSGMNDLTRQIGTSAGSMERLSKNIDKILKDVSNNIDKALTSANSLNTESKNIQNSFSSAAIKLESVKDSLSNTSSSFLQTAKSITSNNESMNRTFNEMMLNYNKKVVEMMRDFGSHVQEQTSDRLRSWDKETENFCRNMSEVVGAMSDLVDNIESKSKR